jgi:hypothetical protein
MMIGITPTPLLGHDVAIRERLVIDILAAYRRALQ